MTILLKGRISNCMILIRIIEHLKKVRRRSIFVMNKKKRRNLIDIESVGI